MSRISSIEKIKIKDKKLSVRWKIFTILTIALLPVSCVLGLYSSYNVCLFLISNQTDMVSLALWSLIFVMCALHIANAIIFRTLNNRYWEREREFNTVLVVSRTLATAADYEKQASAIEKKQEIVNEVTKTVAEEAKTQIEKAVNKGFEGMKTYFASALREKNLTEEKQYSKGDLLDSTLESMGRDSKTGVKAETKEEKSAAPVEESTQDDDVPVDLEVKEEKKPAKKTRAKKTTKKQETKEEKEIQTNQDSTTETQEEEDLFADSSVVEDDDYDDSYSDNGDKIW